MPDDPEKTSCHELRVLATNGRVFQFRVADLDRLYRDRIFLASVAVYCIVLALVDPQVFGVHVQLPLRCLFWGVSALSIMLFISILYRFFAWLYSSLGWSKAFPVAVILLMATGASQLVYNFVGTHVFGLSNIWGGSVLGEFLRYGLVVIAFELLLSTVIFPKEFESASRHNTAQAAARGKGAALGGEDGDARAPTLSVLDQSRILTAGRQSFPVEILIYLKSIEHYVEVVTHDGVETVRVALRNLTDQLVEADGVQPHRSYWVARDAIVGLVKTGGNAFLLLRDGSEIPVARHRRQDVMDWVTEHIG